MEINPDQSVLGALSAYASNPSTALAVNQFAADIFGGPTKNLVGLLGADWLFYQRIENIAKLDHRMRERLKEKGISEPRAVPISLGLPLIKNAADENREELRDIWARLLATAMDPASGDRVRKLFVDIVSKMDPLDAKTLLALRERQVMSPHPRAFLASKFKLTEDEVAVSFVNLGKLGCIIDGTLRHAGRLDDFFTTHEVNISPIGRELLRAIYD